MLDRYDGSPYVSLVAFDFLETRVGGIPWPGFTSFPEINLRFYVRDGDRRGVCFVREIVPKALISFIARALYDEPYVTAPITSTRKVCADRPRSSAGAGAGVSGSAMSLAASTVM